jgi:signal transduction histidine kinase
LNHLGLNAKAIVRTQEVLAQQFSQVLPPEQLLLLQPQLVGLLGEIARGFFEQQVEDRGRLSKLFTASISHELRTPINGIIGYAEIMLKDIHGPLNDEQRNDLTAISRAGQNVLKLVNDLLEVARFEAGYKYTHLKLTTFEIASLIKKSLLLRRSNSDLTLTVDCPPNLGSMHADKGKIEQVLESLLRQAVAFTESGEIRFTGWRDSSAFNTTPLSANPSCAISPTW